MERKLEDEKTKGDVGQMRRRHLIAAIGGGLSALANMVGVMRGAPSSATAETMAQKLTQQSRRIYDAERKRADDREARESAAAMQRIRTEADISLASRREQRQAEAQAETSARAKAADERAERLTQSRIAEAESRMASRQAAEEARTQKEERKPRLSTSRRPVKSASFTWVHPATGERYAVEQSTWEKSAYTMFQMVVDATRPTPDSRGYPTVEEWRRHCFDTYNRSDRRDAYIMRHLPNVPEAMKYLRKLGTIRR